jgi:CDP-diacylglycerol--serine O-phosphatidyltransferase
MEKKPLGYYDYTVILTYCGMLFGFFGIILSIEGKFWKALICLMIAGACDMFDGLVASTKDRTREEKRFGIQIDSMSDMINFGILPAIYVYMISAKTIFGAVVPALYSLATLIRLSFFNVLEEERQEKEAGSRHSYLGLPVTSAALLLPLVYLLFEMKLLISIRTYQIALIIAGTLFLSPIEIKKPGVTGKIIIIVIGLAEVFAMIMFKG